MKSKKIKWPGKIDDCGKGHLFYYFNFGKKVGDKMMKYKSKDL